jgi:tRNA-dihydrouridine synthase A
MNNISKSDAENSEKVPIPSFLLEDNSSNCSEKEIHKLSIAPMLDVTDRNFRVFFRFLSKKATLYTDMIHCDTILYSKYTEDKLKIYPIEKPVVLQLGGSNPINLAKAAKIGASHGYDEINLNVGCPSQKVTTGSFGACLMKEPELVAKCVKAMEEAVDIPVTVKCRLGVDEFDDYEFLDKFVKIISESTKCTHFIIHARKAFLKGLNPKENRNIPPLIYDRVYKIAKDYPNLKFSINGGIKTLEQTDEILKENPDLLGVMMGRAAYQNTWLFADTDRKLFGGENPGLSRRDLFLKYGEFAVYAMQENKHFKIPSMVKPLLGLFANEKGFKAMRRFLSDKVHYKDEKNFFSFMQRLVERMEEINPEGLNQKFDEEYIKKQQSILNKKEFPSNDSNENKDSEKLQNKNGNGKKPLIDLFNTKENEVNHLKKVKVEEKK